MCQFKRNFKKRYLYLKVWIAALTEASSIALPRMRAKCTTCQSLKSTGFMLASLCTRNSSRTKLKARTTVENSSKRSPVRITESPASADFLHKTTTDICKNHAVVHVGALNVAGMTKSASGTVENPGKNVKQRSGLNCAILEQGWGEMLRQLEYKMRRKGGLLVKINPGLHKPDMPALRPCQSRQSNIPGFFCVRSVRFFSECRCGWGNEYQKGRTGPARL